MANKNNNGVVIFERVGRAYCSLIIFMFCSRCETVYFKRTRKVVVSFPDRNTRIFTKCDLGHAGSCPSKNCAESPSPQLPPSLIIICTMRRRVFNTQIQRFYTPTDGLRLWFLRSAKQIVYEHKYVLKQEHYIVHCNDNK